MQGKIPAQLKGMQGRVKHAVGGVSHFIGPKKPARRHGGNHTGTGRKRSRRGY